MTAETWDAITIGSGLGSLAFAARLGAAGKNVLVLERLSNLGGAATLYRHGDLTIEASLHEIDGATLKGPDSLMARLGLAEAIDTVPTDEFYAVRGGPLPGELVVPHGLDRAREAFLSVFPAARDGIESLFAELRSLHTVLAHLEAARGGEIRTLFSDIVSGRLFTMLRATRRTVDAALERHLGTHEDVKLAIGAPIGYFDDDPASLSWLLFGGVWSRYVEDGSFYIKGGSGALTMALAGLVRDRGGAILRKATVSGLLTDHRGDVSGVLYTDESGTMREAFAPVVAAGTAPASVAAMLPEGSAEASAMTEAYRGLQPSVSLFTVSLGLDRPAASLGVAAYSTFVYPEGITALRQYPEVALHFATDHPAKMPPYILCDYGRLDTVSANAPGDRQSENGPGAGLRQPGDPHLVTLCGVDRLHWWEARDEAHEMDRRARWIDALIADADRLFPGFAAAVTHKEIAVARTMRNRLGTPQGEVYGFRPTPQRLFGRRPQAETPVTGLYLSSAYTVAGGYAGSMNGGLMAAEAALGSGRMGPARG